MKSLSISSVVVARGLVVASLLLAAGCSSSTVSNSAPVVPPATATDTGKSKAVPGAFDDDPRPQTATEAAVAAAGLDPRKLSALESQLLATIIDPASTPAAAQDAAQQLGFVALARSPKASLSTLVSLSPLLTDPARFDLARLVIDRIPGAAVDALYLAALATSTGRVRLGLIDATGTRGITGAVPALAALLNDADAPTALAATRALGRIGGATALTALGNAPQPLAPAVLTARLAAAAKTDPIHSAQVATEISRNAQAPLAQRSAALRQLITANPATAVAEIHAALTGNEPAFHAVALEAVTNLRVPGAAAALAENLPDYAPNVQTQLITALGHTGDAGAVPGLLSLLASPEESVRLAAIESLGRLPGNTEIVEELAAIALTDNDQAKAARSALTRLDGTGLDAFVQQAAADPTRDEKARAVFIELIGSRNLTEAIPFLLGLRQSPSASLRLEALDALRFIAAPSDQTAVIAWATGTADRAEQNRAVRAIITIILRDGSVETRAAPVIAALQHGDSATRQILLPVLSRVAGKAALNTASTLARGADSQLAVAAMAELSRWPDASALPVLVELAQSTPLAPIRTAAAQGAARFLTRNTDEIRASRSAQTRVLLTLPLSDPLRQTLLGALSLCADQAALDTARQFLAEPTLATAAQDAVDAITSNLAGPALVTASVDSAKAVALTDGKPNTYWQVPSEKGTWVRLDLHHSRPVRKITLQHGTKGWGYPAKFDVQVSDDPEQPGPAVMEAKGQQDLTTVTLPAGIRGRYLWLRVTAERDAPIAIGEFIVE